MSPAADIARNDRLSLTFGALADPTRRAILARLTRGDASVSAIARPFEISLPAVSRHLKVLEGAGLVSRSRDGKWRPCRLEAARIKEVAVWAGEYRRFWERSFEKLDEVLGEMKEETRGDERD
ncbi:MAG TPA: metalloregulator ArsR/SmtB family transcription factor [Candidatus Limnocylindria bacterium]|nr:metalloregulator ArsR/SmtB family transcription factor [Candidatus Limnocylindria bacterium]